MSTGSMTAEASKKVVSDFLGAWQKRDVAGIMECFTPEATYHNVPVAPIRGIAGIREIFEGFLSAFEYADLEIIRIAAEPNLVFAERIDHFRLHDGRSVDLPVNGVFELKDGKIHRFSDYFDLASFEGPTGLKL
ncbi:limonene-1,2-epoxide hydrolase family protein [Parvibaculum sp.]|uniref:limonene-1,2-epoxide hydrolase family protein n=1 Tax=Parvibaculum sp. TaxID=2024848 RepID=UPI0034A068FE